MFIKEGNKKKRIEKERKRNETKRKE